MGSRLHKVVGIDLGTTYSAVAAYDTYTEQAEIIGNPESDSQETTPSVVSLEPVMHKVIVGSAAKRNKAINPQDTVTEIKREMGELFRPETLAEQQAQGTFNVDDPLMVQFAGNWMRPQEISAFILMKMKEVAEREIGEEIRDAVVTVPAYFKEKQRKATEEAVLLAGLYPRQLISEPTAAAICYGVDRMEEGKKTYLVYDLGGGTFDVSIIQADSNGREVIATSGDSRLGGCDFDKALVQWVTSELQKRGVNPGSDQPVLTRIRERAEAAKINLTYNETAKIDLTFLQNSEVRSLDLSRDVFLGLVDDLLRKTLTFLEKALEDAASQKGVSREQIDAVLLVGGSSKIPRVKSMLLDYFGKDDRFVRSEVNPDTVVARGAAFMGHRFGVTPGPFDVKRRSEATLVNPDLAGPREDDRLITEHSLSVGVQHNLCVTLVEKGRNIPAEVKRGDFTNPDMASKLTVPVFQGEGKYQYENTLIGSLEIGPIEPKPKSFHNFEVTFRLDENGLLNMMVHHVNEQKTYKAKFDQKTGVGGDERLAALRSRLVDMFARSVANVPPDTPDKSGVVPPPPGTTAGPAVTGQTAGGEGAASPGESTPDATRPVGTAPPPARAEATPGQTDPAKPIPDQFKQIVRRTHKQLLRQPDPELLKAWEAFMAALNAGQAEAELEELGDALADAFDRARK